MADYEIRFLKSDGKPTLIYVVSDLSDHGALAAIRGMDGLDYDVVEVWSGLNPRSP